MWPQALLNVLLLSYRAVAADPRNAEAAEALNTEADRRAAVAAGKDSNPVSPMVAAAPSADHAHGMRVADGADQQQQKQQFKPILDPGLGVGFQLTRI